MEFGSINERVSEIGRKAAKENGVEFVSTEIVGNKRNPTVRVYIDKPGGVSLDDCSVVSRAMETVLDSADFIPSAYTLEVSSPGLERGLYSLADFERFAGHKVKVKTSREIDGRRAFSGRIAKVEGGSVILEDKSFGTAAIPLDAIAKANLRVDLAEEFNRR